MPLRYVAIFYSSFYGILVGLAALLLAGQQLSAQTAVTLTSLAPNSGPITVEQLTLTGLINGTGEAVLGRVEASLETLDGEPVVSLRSRPLRLAAGGQVAHAQIPWLRQPVYGRGEQARLLATRGTLQEGEFLLCHRFVEPSGTELGINCIERRALLDINFSLVYPFDGSTVATTRPTLSWENVPQIGLRTQGISYEIKLYEVGSRQAAVTALERNIALLNRRGLKRSSLIYPPGGRRLKEGHTYAWMVRVFQRGREVLTSEVWTFTVGSNAKERLKVPRRRSYALPSTELGGRPYTFGRTIQVGFDNNEGVRKLDYRIVGLSDPHRIIDLLPDIAGLTPGLNNLDIPTAAMNLRDGEVYRLEIRTPRKLTYFLKFRYQRGL